MISRNAAQYRDEIFRLLELSYPNMRRRMLEAMFDRRFEPKRCMFIVDNGRVVSTLQTHRAAMMFMGRCLEVCLIDQVATHPDYRRRHKMSELMEAALDESQHNQLFTLIYAMNPRLFERYGFRTVHSGKRYLLASQEFQDIRCDAVTVEGSAAQMHALYQRFISHFDAVFIRDLAYFQELLDKAKARHEKLCFCYDQEGMSGYCRYLNENHEAKVQEIVYLDSRALRQLLAYVSRTARSVQVTVSDDEQLERIFPQAIPHREDHLMARLNSPALFNKLYNTKAHHAKDAFDLLKKPMWNHSR